MKVKAKSKWISLSVKANKEDWPLRCLERGRRREGKENRKGE